MAITHCVKQYWVPPAWECCLHWAGHVAPTAGFKRGGYAIWGPAGASLPQQEVWHHWLLEAGDRAGVACSSRALHWSQHQWMETSSAVCRWLEWQTRWTHVSLTVLTAQLLRTCWNIFWSTSWLLLQITSLLQRCWCTWHSLECYGFVNPLVAYVCQKSLHAIDIFHCYKQKWKVIPLNLAHL